MKRGDLEALQTTGSEEKSGGREELGEGSGVVVSPTTPNTPLTPGDDNPVFAIPRAEVRIILLPEDHQNVVLKVPHCTFHYWTHPQSTD